MANNIVSTLTLMYPRHSMSTEDLLGFVELKPFTAAWKAYGLTDDDLAAMQLFIMMAPKLPPVIPGAGGLRKARFVPKWWKKGKSGGLRVCYVYFEEFGVVLLVLVYAKNEKDDLTADEKKKIRSLIKRVYNELSKKPIR